MSKHHAHRFDRLLQPLSPGLLMFYLGIDLAKSSFCACIINHDETLRKNKSFKRTPEGLALCISWLNSFVGDSSVKVVMEATGDLWFVPAAKMNSAGLTVCVVNPAQVHNFKKSLPRRHKTDPLDAHLLALLGLQRARLETWTPIEPVRLKFRALMRRINQVSEYASIEKTRLKHEKVDASAHESSMRTLEYFQEEMERLWAAAEEILKENEGLREDVELVDSIQSVSRKTACMIVGELLTVKRFRSAKAMASWAGLIPEHFRSGTSIHKPERLMKSGSKPIRRILYMPAVAGVQHNVALEALNKRLLEKGKSGKTRVVAGMHKLLRQVYGVLHHRQPFDPEKALSGCVS